MEKVNQILVVGQFEIQGSGAGGPVKALDYRLKDLKLCPVHRAFAMSGR